jgi:hypothetical protein
MSRSKDRLQTIQSPGGSIVPLSCALMSVGDQQLAVAKEEVRRAEGAQVGRLAAAHCK